MSEIDALIKAETERVDKIAIQALSNLGDMCVAEARDRAQEESWFNQTGNLRSSVGYVVVLMVVLLKALILELYFMARKVQG